MHTPYFDNPPPTPKAFIPKGKANLEVLEVLSHDGKEMHLPVGYGWSAKPIGDDVLIETIHARYRIVNMNQDDALRAAHAPKTPSFPLSEQDEITFFEEEELTHDWH